MDITEQFEEQIAKSAERMAGCYADLVKCMDVLHICFVEGRPHPDREETIARLIRTATNLGMSNAHSHELSAAYRALQSNH